MARRQVRATRRGFHGGSLVEVGTVFSVDDKDFGSAWMEDVPAEAVPDPPAAVEPVKPETSKRKRAADKRVLDDD